MSSATRRQFLRSATALALTGSIATTAAAQGDPIAEATPEHVTHEFDVETLKRYRPQLVVREIDRAKLRSLFGFVARSPEYDTDVGVYWMEYSHQEGVSPLAPPLNDSHYGDHEPFYVFFDSETGDVVEVVYSAYHWIAGKSPAASTPMDETHPKAHIVRPWHHYYLTEETGVYVDLADLTQALGDWWANGMDESLYLEGVTVPWRMRTRAHWWQDTAAGFSIDAWYAKQLYRLGWVGADNPEVEI